MSPPFGGCPSDFLRRATSRASDALHYFTVIGLCSSGLWGVSRTKLRTLSSTVMDPCLLSRWQQLCSARVRQANVATGAVVAYPSLFRLK